jgi:hypothetical protein
MTTPTFKPGDSVVVTPTIPRPQVLHTQGWVQETGTVISYNTEGPYAGGYEVLLDDPDALGSGPARLVPVLRRGVVPCLSTSAAGTRPSGTTGCMDV